MIGKRLGPYEITAKLGEGGMGEVYRATDTRLKREVAIKVLPAAFIADIDRLARFEREAQLLAQLHHPNIASIFGLEEAGGVRALVMELVPGPTLAERLESGRLPFAECLSFALQIAQALEEAHDKGIVHRDLKPQNIKASSEGEIKVLDFGLAKAMDTAAGSSAAADLAKSPTLMHSPTMTAAAIGGGTQMGVILGTAAYMAPEQARGTAVDARADVWAFGVVLYEMLAGGTLFASETVADTLAAVLTREIDWSRLPASTPPAVLQLLRRCLERKPRERLHSIADARQLLADFSSGRIGGVGGASVVSGTLTAAPDAVVPRARTIVRLLPWTIAALAALAAIFLALRKVPAAVDAAAGSEIHFAPLTSFSGVESPGSWSPDGSFLAYSHSAEGSMDLFVLPTAGGAPISLYKSAFDEGAPRWSPDSKWIAFTSFKEGRAGIFLVSPLGGPAQKLVDLPQREPESDALVALGKQPWSPDGRWLLFARAREKGGTALWRIDLEGREEKELLPAVEGQSFAEPSLAPDGRRIVFTRASIDGRASLWLLDLDASEARPLVDEKANAMEPLFSPGGEAVIFVSDRAGNEGNVWTIDLASRRITPITLSPTLVNSPVAARDGRLAVATSSHQTDLYLDAVDGGSQRRLTFHTHDNFGPRLSPDGRKIAYMSNRTGDPEIWLLDLESGEERRLTDNPARDMSPTWAPDGRSILFSSDRDPAHPLWTLEVDGGRIEPVGKGVAALDKLRPVWGQWAPDGSRLGLAVSDDSRNGSLWTLARDGKLSGPFLPGLREFDFYRDGRTILYVRDGKEGEGLELRAADLENGADELLYRGWVRELAVSRDGRLASFILAESHINLNLFVLELAPPQRPGELPRALGAPRAVTEGKGRWHVHNGSRAADGRLAAYTRDTDTADVFVVSHTSPH